MIIEKVILKNFRNYTEECIFFNKKVNIIYGFNGQGKTNIIEALYIFSTGKSHRTNNLNELIKHGQNFFEITLFFTENNYYQNIKIFFEKNKKKILFLNDIKQQKFSNILGIIPTVLFAPECLLYIKGSPQERRRFLDITLCQLSKVYLSNMQKYIKILKNKNALLKRIKEKRENIEVLDVWNNSLAQTGSLIIKQRNNFIQDLKKDIKEVITGISNNEEEIEVKYKTSININENNFENEFLYLVNEHRTKEIEYGTSLIGPHRDEIEFYINNKNARLFCSQGQQRSIALALNIAIINKFEREIQKYPILLLDDVMSELDNKRQKYLLDIIYNYQTIITTIEKNTFNKNNSIKFINIINGKVHDG